MKEQVIKLSPDGTGIETLLKDSFFDTRFLGKREIERISEIIHLDSHQKFAINILLGPTPGMLYNSSGDLWVFDTYEQAVAYEIAYINEQRLAGVQF